MAPTSQALVIGSGFGGLAAAIRLQSAGYKTTLLDRRDQPGGRAYVYRMDGHTFDAGPTVITDPQCLRDLFSEAQRNLDDYVQLMPVSPFYQLRWEDGREFNYSNNEEELLDQIKAFSNDDAEGYAKFASYSKEVYREGYERLGAKAFTSFSDMIRVAPTLFRLKAYRSVYSQVSRFIKHPQLRQAFSFHSLLVGGNPFSTPAIYTLIHHLEKKGGVYFPMGGTSALVSGLMALFKELGGQIRLSTDVDKIETRGAGVRAVWTTGRERIPADIIVSNADVVHTYQKLLREEPQSQKMGRSLAKRPHSMSLFLVYFGTRKKYPHVAHHTVLFGNRYKSLLKDIFNKGILADDFSLYLHRPSATDASMAPPDGETFYVLSPVPHLGKLSIDWRYQGNIYGDKILSYLEERLLPNLKDYITVKKIYTPLDFQQDLNAHWGSAFSLEPLLRQSAYFRVHNRDQQIKGLYFVGAGTHPGAGLPGVINSAKATCELIQKDYPVKQSLVYQ